MAAQIGGVDLVGMQRLGDGIGHRLSAQHLAERHAHQFSEGPRLGGMVRHLIEGGDPLHQPMVDDLGTQREDKISREKLGGRHLEPAVGAADGEQHLVVGGKGFLDGCLEILQQHQRGAHVRDEEGAPLSGVGRAHKALPLERSDAGMGEGRDRHAAFGKADAVAAAVGKSGREHLRKKELLEIIALFGTAGVDSRDQQNPSRRLLPDLFRESGAAQHPKQLGGADQTVTGEAQRAPARGVPHDHQHSRRFGQADRLLAALGKEPAAKLLAQRPVGIFNHVEADILRTQRRLILRFAQIKAVVIDEFLHDRVDEGRDVPVQVDVLADAGRADLLQVGRQRKLDDLAGDAGKVPDLGGGVPVQPARPAEDDMVHPVDREIRRLRPVGGGVAHHVAADGDIKLPAREGLGEPLEVGGIGEVHRNIIREEVNMELVGHRHADNLPPDQMGLGFFRPREFVYREINLEAQIADRPHNPLVGEGEGVEGPGKEGDLVPVLKAERTVIDPLQRDEPVDMREGRRPVEEGELAAAVLL